MFITRELGALMDESRILLFPSVASATTKILHYNGRGRCGRALVVETRNFASLQCAGAVTVLPC